MRTFDLFLLPPPLTRFFPCFYTVECRKPLRICSWLTIAAALPCLLACPRGPEKMPFLLFHCGTRMLVNRVIDTARRTRGIIYSNDFIARRGIQYFKSFYVLYRLFLSTRTRNLLRTPGRTLCVIPGPNGFSRVIFHLFYSFSRLRTCLYGYAARFRLKRYSKGV